MFKTLRRSGTFAAGTLLARRLRAVVAMAHRMSRAARALLALLVVCAPGRVSQGWGPATAHAWAPREVLSTDDLAANAYPSATHVPCVLLLNATGSIGCSTPAGGVTAPLRRFEGLADVRRRLASRTILLLPASAFPEVLADYAKGAGWKAHAAGFMLEPGVDEHGNPPPVSSAEPSSDEGNDRDAPSTAGATLARLLARIDLGARRSFSPQPRIDDDDRALHARAWNPDGFGAARARFENTPIVLLDASGADVARTFAAANGERGTSRVAEMRFPMDAAAAANDANPARRCLEQRTCQPIGGHSVLASVPLSPSTPETTPENIQNIRPYLLVAARLDATALFHDAAFGANAAMSGLVALLAVAKTYADAIQNTRERYASSDASNDASAVSRSIAFERFLNEDAVPITFAAFGAEAWGRAGSRRFARLARDAARNIGVSVSDSNSERSTREFLVSEREETSSRRETRTATRSSVDALPRWMRRGFELGGVIDFGAVGFAAGHETKNNATTSTVFAHANAAARNKEKAGFPLIASVEASFASSSNHLAFARASVAPGALPPSSASSFSPSREKLGEGDGVVPAVVLAEYDGAYVDGTFGSAFDVGVAAVDTSKIASLVSGVAGALASLALDDAEYGALVRANLPDSASVERTTRALAECLIDPEVGFECALAQRLFMPSATFPSRYAGVAPSAVGKPDFDSEAEGRVGAGADDVARFAWAFLADATAPRGSASAGRGPRRVCDDASDAGVSCADGEVCVRVAGDDESDESSPSETTSVKAQNEPRRALLGSDVFGADSGTVSGTCVESSARFLPALSRLVTFDDDENRWTFSPDDVEDEDADPDAVWCESDWPSSVGARVFREASAAAEWAALVAGAAATSLAALLTNRLDAVARARFKEE